MLGLLETRSELVPPRRAALKQRKVDWQPLFELAAPFDNVDTVFTRGTVGLQNGRLQLSASYATKKTASRTLGTQLACDGNTQCEVVFDASWEQAAELGVALNFAQTTVRVPVTGLVPTSSREVGYCFLLRTANSREVAPDDEEQPPVGSFANARVLAGSFNLIIQHNGAVVQRQLLPASAFPPGPLHLRATRERDRLTLQVNSLRPVEFFDPFPLDSHVGTFGIHWSPGVEIVEFRGASQTFPEQASGLEEADRLYDAKRFAEALTAYRAEAPQVSEQELQQEVRYKQAITLVALNRDDEAASLFEPLLTEPGERRPPAAGCQLWLLRVRQKRDIEADAVFENLSTRFRFEQLAALLPNDARQAILTLMPANSSRLQVFCDSIRTDCKTSNALWPSSAISVWMETATTISD